MKDIWPDAELEKQMLGDAGFVENNYAELAVERDLCSHVKALLTRVRELERFIDRKRMDARIEHGRRQNDDID